MSLVFSATTPHPPILIPGVGKKNLKKISKTRKALQDLEYDLYAVKPDSLIIISPHGVIAPDCFLINVASQYEGQFEEFGDFTTKVNFEGDLELISNIKEAAEENGLTLNLVSQTKLDHGSSVPLYYLLHHLSETRIIPLSYCLLNFKSHLELGKIIQKEILKTNKRVAVIASGDLSHRLTEEAPAGFSPRGQEFDQTLIQLLKIKNVEGIINLDSELIEEAGECGLRSFIILLGVLDNIDYKPRILSYEGPFGVGYLVANFDLS